jgi:hypothetical protein
MSFILFGHWCVFCKNIFMAFDDLKKLTTGFIKGWKKGKLKETLKQTAEIAMEEKIKNAELEETIRQLQDENLRLKGEKSKPKIKPANTNKDLNPKKKKPHKKKPKKADLEIDETVELDVDKDDLPNDAKKVGTRDVVVQEMRIERRNIKFVIHRYWSNNLGRVIEGEVPQAFKGSEFGPQLRTFVNYQFYKCRTPHKKILSMLKDWEIEMSAGTLCRLLNNIEDEFKEDLMSAKNSALKKQSRVFIDDTGARIKGVNGNTYGICNDYFTEYVTGLEKNRWSAVGALLTKQKFYIDDDAISFVANKLKRAKVTVQLYPLKGKEFNRDEFEAKLKEIYTFSVRKDELDIVRTAAAISALRRDKKIKFLVSDDGTNFVDIVKSHQLCWVHEIRKYKKLPLTHEVLVKELDRVIDKWRSLYKKMKRFIRSPNDKLRQKIREEFDKIVADKTKIKLIDKQLELTKKNKDKLLLFLKYPQLPLHSNMVERDLRERVIKRKISLQNRSWSGVRAWDLMLSLMSTCRKLNLSFWHYLEDRISKREKIPYLGKLVTSL